MKLEYQVCGLKLAKSLKEFGINQEGALLYWVPLVRNQWELMRGDEMMPRETVEKSRAAFTGAELGRLLLTKKDERYALGFRTFLDYQGKVVCGIDGLIGFSADTEADARAKMLIYLLENNLIDAETISTYCR
jgi:hypothetical protein